MSYNCCTIYNKWDMIPYPESNITPIGETPSAGSWPLYYFKRNNGGFTDLLGSEISFDIKAPEQSDGFTTTELQQVVNVGKNLTEQQKIIATYWGAGVPQNQFIPIKQCLINTYSVPPTSASRIDSILETALNDAMIICWHYKYLYQIPRPVQYNPNFTPYLKTPYHPSYPAGHSVSAGCVDGILSYFFPTEANKITKLCEECSISRLYGGVHYRIDLVEGYKLGLDIAKYVLEEVKNASDKYGATANVIFNRDKNANLKPPSYNQINYCGN
ncbi:MAG: vanadium-dependent haloperoxidase [Clostridium sp.]